MELHLHLSKYSLRYLYRAVAELTHRTIPCTFFTFERCIYFSACREKAVHVLQPCLLFIQWFPLAPLRVAHISRSQTSSCEIKAVQQRDACCGLFTASWHLACPSLGSRKLCLDTQSCNCIFLPKATKGDPTWRRKIFPHVRVSGFQMCNPTQSEAAFCADLASSLLQEPSDPVRPVWFPESYCWLRALEGRWHSWLTLN